MKTLKNDKTSDNSPKLPKLSPQLAELLLDPRNQNKILEYFQVIPDNEDELDES